MTPKKFEILFRQLYLPLGMYALRIVNDTDIAEDLVQEAFIKVWCYTKEGGKIENFKFFIYRTLRNLCLTHIRDSHSVLSEEFIPDVPDEDIDTSFRDAKIWNAIDNLPEKCREIFLLSKRDGLSNQEIADELNISIKTVKNQMTKALSRLREDLSDNHKPFFLPFF